MMDWAEDFKFLKKSAKKGRRAGNSSSTATTSVTSPTLESLTINDKPDSGGTSSSSNNMNVTSDERNADDVDEYIRSQRVRRTGGWADEGVKSPKSATNVIEQERFSSITNTTHFSDDDIPIIPDLDDVQDDLLMSDLVEAPILAENRTATYKELNSDLMKQAAFTAMEDVDLSILGRCLQNDLAEPDEEWNWDKLFTEISSDIHADKPKSAEGPATQYVN
ncbi:intraflagellar transport protein 43 homolog [Bradysia coprophila]|uniref:intraflagellar transport protein 43 homolog n=1 Tax=Bradysia coprophila TaxID=38358 RepID=UPI00187DCD30|nr:intraflagellar transport protein 43 homolog [Bradysia coprophila]XP_037052442.1 intraflagellar transport protein 43 homolog [Bradysia coprophila]